MTDDQRQRLDRLADRCDDWPCNYEDFEAIGAALAEIDRLRGENDKLKCDLAVTDDHLGNVIRQNDELMAAVKGYEEAEPPRPEAIVCVVHSHCHLEAFEDAGDAERWRNEHFPNWASPPPLWHADTWTWHPRKEGTRGTVDDETGG